MLSSCTLPWTRSGHSSIASNNDTLVDDRDDSAFHEEPEYSNPASYGSSGTSGSGSGSSPAATYQNHQINLVQARQVFCADQPDEDLANEVFAPDYEEVDPEQVEKLRRALQKTNLVYNVAADSLMMASNSNKRRPDVLNTTSTIDMNSSQNHDAATEERIMKSLIYCIHKVANFYG